MYRKQPTKKKIKKNGENVWLTISKIKNIYELFLFYN